MSIFDYLISFWQESDKMPFSTSEAAVYHHLLYEANRNHWVMPIRCSTVIMCHRLSTSRQNIQKARESLKQRGYIDYVKGIGKRKPAEYTLLALPGQLPDQLSHYNIKKKDVIIDVTTTQKEEAELLKTSSLREILLSDIDWQNKVIALIESNGNKIEQEELTRQIVLFFQTLSVMGITMKTDHDCRSHFYHWVCKQLGNSKNNNHDKNTNPRRGVDVPAPSEQNYEGAF